MALSLFCFFALDLALFSYKYYISVNVYQMNPFHVTGLYVYTLKTAEVF